MIRFFFVLIIVSGFWSCKDKPVATTESRDVSDFEMYQPSEMAILMRQMYEFNKLAKEQIRTQTFEIDLPENFRDIHSLEMTEPKERDEEYHKLAERFLAWQQKAFKTQNRDSAIVYFNLSVQTCVACHQTRCTGPIPKIKKLYIH